MADFTTFEAELKAEHARLTKAYEEAHAAAEVAWADAEAKSSALTAFREKYGRVLRAFDAPATKKKAGVTASASLTVAVPTVSTEKE